MRALLVDDDLPFRTALAANLRFDGHDVLECSEPARLPPVQDLKNVHVLITDYHMPHEDGLNFADRFHRQYPGIPVVLITAFPSDHLSKQLHTRTYIHLVLKPVDYHPFHDLLKSWVRTHHAPTLPHKPEEKEDQALG